MKNFLFASLLILSGSLHAQNVSTVKKEELVSDSAFTSVEIESEFPGGLAAWSRFLQENLSYPKKAVKKNIQGTVVLQFIVNKDGSISDLIAISGPEELRQAAIDALKNTPKWIPASQFGKKVKSYKKQPITFRLQ